ncbi:MAG TPA: helix-turn-helix domain-containing protein [Rectinemataceae bacterium]|nr:helix-turn-helix domain-containing protein [Rectinemataceae bacterium]
MISNIFAPLVAGLFFLLYFIYFIIANPSKAASYRYFVIFLISMSVFTLGRPFQLMLGPHPLPLIVVNIRVFILCAVIAPIIILASDLFAKRRKKTFQAIIVSVCVLLGLTYVVFNTLGTDESKVLFGFAGMIARDNHTPSGMAPFYGREVTIAVQVVIGLILLLFSLVKLVALMRETSLKGFLRSQVFLFNGGVFIFAASFIMGSLLKQWGIYYAASVASALLFGASVMIDAKEVHRGYEKLIPFIKEDIVDNVAFSEFSKPKLAEMLGCLGKGDLNTIVVMKIMTGKPEALRDLSSLDEVMRIAGKAFENAFSEECFLLIPLSRGRIMAVLKLAEDTAAEDTAAEGDAAERSARLPAGGKRAVLWDALEGIQTEARRGPKCGLAIGIGRSCGRMEDLRLSYHEALKAQEYAERLETSSIIHVETLDGLDRRESRYPVKEKESLLSLIEAGEAEKAGKACAEFMVKFAPFVAERPEVLKVRLYEFVGSLIDAAILGGGDENRLNELVAGYFGDIDHAKDPEMVGKWMEKVAREVAEAVAHVHENRSKSLVKRAMKYVEENSELPLSYRDVAKEVFVSPSYFLFLFKRERGLTFVDFLTAVRVEKAKLLLATTEKNVTEIAFEVGFNNPNYFSSTFRKLVGMSPKEYRGGETSEIAAK